MEIVPRDEIMEAAKALGEALRDSEECRAVEEALEALSVDEEVNKILSETELIRQSIQESRIRGMTPAQNELDVLKQLDMKSNSNPIIKNHLEAQKKLQVLLEQLNAEISNILGIDFSTHSRQKSGCH